MITKKAIENKIAGKVIGPLIVTMGIMTRATGENPDYSLKDLPPLDTSTPEYKEMEQNNRFNHANNIAKNVGETITWEEWKEIEALKEKSDETVQMEMTNLDGKTSMEDMPKYLEAFSELRVRLAKFGISYNDVFAEEKITQMITQSIQSGRYEEVKDEEAKKMLDSYSKSLEAHGMPEYVVGDQQCIQDFELSRNNWKADLMKNDPEHAYWADNNNMRMVTAKDEWHAMAALSPTGRFAYSDEVYIVDPRYNDYRGKVSEYDNEYESSLQVFTDYAMQSLQGDYETEEGREYAATHIRPTGSVIEFAPGSQTQMGKKDDTVERLINTRSQGLTDKITGLPMNATKPYYRSKDDPNMTYGVESYELRMNDAERSNMELVNGPKIPELEVDFDYRPEPTLNPKDVMIEKFTGRRIVGGVL